MADEDHRNLVTIVREDADEHLTSQTQPTDRPERAIQVAYLEPISARGSCICIGAEQIILGRLRNCTVQLEDPRVRAFENSRRTDQGLPNWLPAVLTPISVARQARSATHSK
jgi:hypothetical protein